MICTNFPFLRAEYEDCFRPVVEPLPGGDSRAVAPLTLGVRELVESGVQTYSSGAFLPIGGEFFWMLFLFPGGCFSNVAVLYSIVQTTNRTVTVTK